MQKCLFILKDKQLALISEKINNTSVQAEFKPIQDVIDMTIVPKIDSKLIYKEINVKSNTFSFSSHIKKWQKVDKNGISICNDRPNTPRCDFLYCILKKYMNDDMNILELGPGVAFIPAYIIQDNLNCRYMGIDPQKEVHNKNIELYKKYKNIKFLNDKVTTEHLDNNYNMILHFHPWIHSGWESIYNNIAKNIKPKYFVIQTYGNVNNSPNQVRKIYMGAINIFLRYGYKKELQIYDLNINNIYYNNKWWCPTNQTVIVMKYDK